MRQFNSIYHTIPPGSSQQAFTNNTQPYLSRGSTTRFSFKTKQQTKQSEAKKEAATTKTCLFDSSFLLPRISHRLTGPSPATPPATPLQSPATPLVTNSLLPGNESRIVSSSVPHCLFLSSLFRVRFSGSSFLFRFSDLLFQMGLWGCSLIGAYGLGFCCRCVGV